MKEAVELYGVKNLLFKFVVFCFDKTTLPMTSFMGFGLIVDGENAESHYFVIEESRYEIAENYKVGFTNLEQNPLVPNKTFYIGDFESMVNDGYASVFAITPDGLTPLFVTLTDVATFEELKAIAHVEDNFFLLQPFIGELETDWNHS